MRISRRTVEAARSNDKDEFFWDDGLRGFGLKVTAAGAKIYVIQYRIGGRGSATRRYTIGRHGSPWEATTARAEAQRLMLMVKGGIDPRTAVVEQQRERQLLQFDRYVQFFLERYAAKRWRPRTLLTHESNLRRWVVPVLGTRTLAEITRRDIVGVMDRIPATNPALPRN